MAFKLKPAWLLDESRLQEILHHHLFLPQDIPTLTSLQDSSAFLRGMKSYLFWKGQLSPSLKPNIIYLAFLGPQGLQDPNVINVTGALKDVINLTKIIEFYRGVDTHFFALSFESKEQVTQILTHFKYYNDAIVLTISHDDAPHHRFRLLWLPPLFDVARVHHLLNKHTASHRLRREFIPIADGGFTPSNIVSGVLTLRPDTQVDDLPYLIQLPPPHKGCALLNIEGRAPLCLKCREIGHTRQQCSMSKCLTCSKVHFPSSPCGVSSYSSVASRNITASTDDDWLGHLCDDDGITSSDTTNTQPILPNNDSTASSQDIASSSSSSTSLISSHTPTQDFIQNSINNSAKCDLTSISTGISSLLNTSDTPSDTFNPDVPSLITKTDLPIDPPTLDGLLAPPFHASTTPDCTAPNSYKPSAIPISKHNQRLSSSKVIITELPSLASTARSHIITYSTAPSTTSTSYPSRPTLTDTDPSGFLFGDPNPETIFSPNSDSDSDTYTKMDTSDATSLHHPSRKRKVLHHIDNPPPPNTASTSSFTSLPVPTSLALDDQDNPNLASTSITLSAAFIPPEPRTAIFSQAADIYGADDDLTSALESVCPNGSFTPDIIKSLRLLNLQGFNFEAIIAIPQILNIRSSELRKKIKSLQNSQGIFTLLDICHQSRIEAKASFIAPPKGLQHP